MSKELKEADYQLLKKQMDRISEQGRVFTNQEVYTYIRWKYGKGRWWTDKYVLPKLKWKELKTGGYYAPVIGKYLALDNLKSQLRSILNDYSV